MRARSWILVAAVLGPGPALAQQAPEFCSVFAALCGAPAVGVPYAFTSRDVCYNGAALSLPVRGSCPSGATAYHLALGEQDASGAIAPLDVTAGPEEGAMCCDFGSGVCTPTDGICPPDKIALWCEDGSTGVLLQGEWVCEESEPDPE